MHVYKYMLVMRGDGGCAAPFLTNLPPPPCAKMVEREVTREEYEAVFETIRALIEKIEHDPRLRYNGFELKQELREVVRSLIKIEKLLFT